MTRAPREPIFDRADLLARLGGDEALLREIVTVFREERQAMQRAIHEACAQGKSSDLERLAHSMKGALLNLSAPRAALIARRLEDQGSRGDLTGCGELLPQLDLELERLNEQLG